MVPPLAAPVLLGYGGFFQAVPVTSKKGGNFQTVCNLADRLRRFPVLPNTTEPASGNNLQYGGVGFGGTGTRGRPKTTHRVSSLNSRVLVGTFSAETLCLASAQGMSEGRSRYNKEQWPKGLLQRF